MLLRALRWASLALLFASCAPGDFSYSKRLVGQYRISAIDDLDSMAVCYNMGGGACSDLIDATVFEVGWDDRYIVAAQHPAGDPEQTAYYYIDQEADDLTRAGVFGPFTAGEFQAETRRLSLPPMSRYAPFIYCSDRPLCSGFGDMFR